MQRNQQSNIYSTILERFRASKKEREETSKRNTLSNEEYHRMLDQAIKRYTQTVQEEIIRNHIAAKIPTLFEPKNNYHSDVIEFNVTTILSVLTGTMYCTIAEYKSLCNFMLGAGNSPFQQDISMSLHSALLRPWILQQYPNLSIEQYPQLSELAEQNISGKRYSIYAEMIGNEYLLQQAKEMTSNHKLFLQRLSGNTVKLLNEAINQLSDKDKLSNIKCEQISLEIMSAMKPISAAKFHI